MMRDNNDLDGIMRLAGDWLAAASTRLRPKDPLFLPLRDARGQAFLLASKARRKANPHCRSLIFGLLRLMCDTYNIFQGEEVIRDA